MAANLIIDLNTPLPPNDVDPLDLALAPPDDETPDQRTAREKLEREAIQRSRCIDAELRAAKATMKRYKSAIKILVLGQSLSGKSTTIKNFQLTYAQKTWAEERASWRAVILLNLVRSVNIIVEVLKEARASERDTADDSQPQPEAHNKHPSTTTTEQHRSVLLRLAPLKEIEKDLKVFLGAGSSEPETNSHSIEDDAQTKFRLELNKVGSQEFSVHSSSGWKSVLDQIRNPQLGKESQLHRVACQVVSSCKDDIRWLWNDSVTQEILHNRNLRLEDSPGFFLEDIGRIAALDYQPSDADIVRARLRTTGVQEHRFKLDRSNGTTVDWIMYDVAGTRSSRAAWIPYFHEITALIFLAPLSSFNERLAEDDRVNCLEDTFVLWRLLSANKILANVQLILFLNKTDLLRKKLEQGIRVKKYIPEFDKANDYDTVATWFRRVFKRIYVDNTQSKRPFISHFTSVVDTQATAQTLQAVQATILRNDMTEAGLM
ncbi:hypothetical protein M413DRAFT_24337 [Hebeloma cylindrosporum]|uniref:G-alpha-domain-containing protein n=1 Tax=Hebeloma cylindrosporum TaxID=76867 RepID=A0A0C2Y5G8_HEBCY|nr:hypothetical protein M413DRAFT_24337 [Hebeloma cylindrosporum h7]